MHIGMICYPSIGGSGIVATELAVSLASRGHQVHLISTELPFRLSEYVAGVTFHRAQAPEYPVLHEPQYLIALANKTVQVARTFGLQLIHAHYAIPHAAAAYLARQILADRTPDAVPRVITTLHGTDITLLGSDPSYSETVAFCIDHSDGVTAVSESLRTDTYRELPVRSAIRVIPNFLDCALYRRVFDPVLRDRLSQSNRFEKLVVHVSNFRAVKRVEAVIEIFHRIRARVNARLLLVGNGPDRSAALDLARRLGLEWAVTAPGEQQNVISLLAVSDLFLLPSTQESFGLAALEAMGCEVPVVASRVGGLPEVIDDGMTGFLHEPGDLDGMAHSAIRLLTDEPLRERIVRNARTSVEQRFCAQRIVPQYEALYTELLERPSGDASVSASTEPAGVHAQPAESA
ncbi:MAG: N-acetyl-alpha-D-glucosaminyl L-malate synthase BshA [Luteitalea sp.]|nr:N-acetyl-alpha-D-glucosaminyl L-malate synthase BshA [Luteitalea sp.]